MKVILYPYKMFSTSSKVLAEHLNTKRVRENGRYIPRKKHVIINWGNPRIPSWWNIVSFTNILNNPHAVSVACNKLATFRTLFNRGGGGLIPKFVTSLEEAEQLLISEGEKIVCRSLTRSNSGKGIVVAKSPEDLIDAPLYTQYFRKTNEYRVHVFNGKIIDQVEKRKVNGYQELSNYNKYIRSHGNGWIFARENVVLPDCVKDAARISVALLGLDFGAVDIGYNRTHNKCCVFEVNTAPGIEGTTVTKYVEAIKEYTNAF